MDQYDQSFYIVYLYRDNSDLKIDQIGVKEGIEFGYVYDFGDNIQCCIKLNEILPV